MKIHKLYFWLSSVFILLFEGTLPLLTLNNNVLFHEYKALGYPTYFTITVLSCKLIGSFIIIVPFVPRMIKEWTYAGFSFVFIFAFISHLYIDGIKMITFFPLVVLGILQVSYWSYRKLRAHATALQHHH